MFQACALNRPLFFDCVNSQNAQEGGINVLCKSEVVARARFGVVDRPQEASVKSELAKWGELREISVGQEIQGRGVEKRLFRTAAHKLASWGCKCMLIKAPTDDLPARQFYENMGAVYSNEIVEQNIRNGTVYNAPCALYLLDLGR